jgi:hypothetical protein
MAVTTFTVLPNAAVQAGGRPRGSTVTALRDNPIAIAEKDPSVPIGLRLGPTLLGTIATTSGSSQSLNSLDLSIYNFLRLTFVGVGETGSSQINLNGVQVYDLLGTGDTVRGFIDIDLSNGVFAATLANAGVSDSGAANPRAGDTDITTASTSITISTPGTFDGGSVRVYGIR